MLRRLLLIPGLFALVALFAVSPLSAKAAESEEAARQFISSMADQAIATLAAKDLDHEERLARFRRMLSTNFDVETMGRWVLGRYWRKATDQERAEYLKLFENLIVYTYSQRFSSYKGETLQIVGTGETDDKDIMVQSKIVNPKGESIVRVDWRVRTADNRSKVVDVMVEGVSMGLTQRSEFASVIRQNGGEVEALLVELRKRLNGGA